MTKNEIARRVKSGILGLGGVLVILTVMMTCGIRGNNELRRQERLVVHVQEIKAAERKSFSETEHERYMNCVLSGKYPKKEVAPEV